MIGEKFQSLVVIEKDEAKNNQLKEHISSSKTFEKESILERFNEDYFLTKKLVQLCLVECS